MIACACLTVILCTASTQTGANCISLWKGVNITTGTDERVYTGD